MEPALPFKAGALFRSVKRVKRGDIVLVQTAETGPIARKVRAVSVNGRVALHRLSRDQDVQVRVESIDPDQVLGRLALRLGWVRFLPRLGLPIPRSSIAGPSAAPALSNGEDRSEPVDEPQLDVLQTVSSPLGKEAA